MSPSSKPCAASQTLPASHSSRQKPAALNSATQAYLVSHILDVIRYVVRASQDDSKLTVTANSLPAHTIDKPATFQLLLIGEITSLQPLTTALQHSIGLDDTLGKMLLGQPITITMQGIQDFMQANFVQRYDLGCFIHPQLGLGINKATFALTPHAKTEPDTTQSDTPKGLGQHSVNPSLEARDNANVLPVFNTQPDAEATNTNISAPLTKTQLTLVATRLRDLFAQQSLLFMPAIIAVTPVESALPLKSASPLTPPLDTKLSTAEPTAAVEEATKALLPNNYGIKDMNDTSGIAFDDLGYTLSAAKADAITLLVRCWQFNLYDYKPQPAWLNSRYWANPDNFDKFRW